MGHGFGIWSPVWPEVSCDRLTFVPLLGESQRCVCVVIRAGAMFRSLLTPSHCDCEGICKIISFATGWQVVRLGLPSAVQAAVLRSPSATLVSRPGDVFDVVTVTAEGPLLLGERPLARASSLPWASPFTVRAAAMAALWYPELHQPVYVCVQRGSCWHPERLTFVGDFDDRHPGRWVPVMWQPDPLIHLMQASEVPGRVHVLHESREGVVPLRLTSQISRLDIAEELHSLAACISVLGAMPEDETVPMQLRDGDIVLDSFMYEEPWHAVWALPSATRSVVVPIVPLLCLFGGAHQGWGSLVCLVALPLSLAMPRSRSRSSAPSRSSSSPPPTSPRAGMWRPEHERPMFDVMTKGQGHYHVWSPFHGCGPPAYFQRGTAGASLDCLVKEFCGDWCRFHVLLGPLVDGGPMCLLAGGQHDLATIMAVTAGQMQAMLVPRGLTAKELHALLQRRMMPDGNELIAPPALVQHCDSVRLPLRLRDGDTFGWGFNMLHPFYREPALSEFRHVRLLPHGNQWHAPFTVRHDDWVYVWHPHEDPAEGCERFWIEAGCRWSPRVLQFLRPRLPLGPFRLWQ